MKGNKWNPNQKQFFLADSKGLLLQTNYSIIKGFMSILANTVAIVAQDRADKWAYKAAQGYRSSLHTRWSQAGEQL